MIFDIENPEGKVSNDSYLEDDDVIINLIQQRKKLLNEENVTRITLQQKWERWCNHNTSSLNDSTEDIKHKSNELQKLYESINEDIEKDLVNINDINKKKIIETVSIYYEDTVKELSEVLEHYEKINNSSKKVLSLVKLLTAYHQSPPEP